MEHGIRQKARAQRGAYAVADALAQRLVQRQAGAQHDKQRHVALAAQVFQVHHHAVEHFGQGLDGAIDFTGAHAQAVAVDGGVAAAVNHAALGERAAGADAQPVAVAPDAAGFGWGIAAAGAPAVAARVHLKITGQVTLVIRVAPKIQWHAGDGLGADQLAHFPGDGRAGLVPGFYGAAQQAALHDAGLLRQLAVAADESAAKVGAARNIAPPNVGVWPDLGGRLGANLPHLGAAPALRLRRQRRAGRAQGADAREVAQLGQFDACFLTISKKRRPGAEECHAIARGKAPQCAPVGRVFGA